MNMTPGEFYRQVRSIIEDNRDDFEAVHSYFDELVEEVMRSMGYDLGYDEIKRYRKDNNWSCA